MNLPKPKMAFLILFISLLCSAPVLAADPPNAAQAQQTVAFVDKAAAVLSTQGSAAFPQFKVKDGDWWKGDSYIYIYGLDGTLLMHPIYPSLEGQNLSTLQDIHMKAFVQQLTAIANAQGKGWFDFMLARPGQTLPARKWAYVRTVRLPDGKTVVVGSGFWEN